ncbi:MAG: TIGR03905 family TSCPD domain-containing protein [Bacteroidales bacterium]|nr:TIGR03905 family TSCPD domain-containing protein [Bacteroidales bacterium]
MERRDFIKKAAMAVAAAAVTPGIMSATESYSIAAEAVGDDFKVLSDTTKDGVRYVTATPSAKVCSKQIDIEINVKDQTIRRCEFTRGCPGNAVGLCSLLQGMKVSEAIKRLKGTPCATRGTSCPDQLARVLDSLK